NDRTVTETGTVSLVTSSRERTNMLAGGVEHAYATIPIPDRDKCITRSAAHLPQLVELTGTTPATADCSNVFPLRVEHFVPRIVGCDVSAVGQPKSAREGILTVK